MKFYVISGDVLKRNVNEESLRQALVANDQVYAFRDRQQANTWAASISIPGEQLRPDQKRAFAVYEVEIEVGSSLVSLNEELTLEDGTTLNASIINHKAATIFEPLSATFNGQNYHFVTAPSEPVRYYVVSPEVELSVTDANKEETLRNALFNGDEVLAGFYSYIDAYLFVNNGVSLCTFRDYPIYEVLVTGNKGIRRRNDRNAVEISHKEVEKIEVIRVTLRDKTYNLSATPVVSVEPVQTQTVSSEPASTVIVPSEPVQTQTVQPEPVQPGPVEPPSVQPDPVQPASATESFLNTYGKGLLVGALYLATTAAIVAIPGASLPVAAAATAVGFGLAYAATIAGFKIYAYAKSAWDRYNMTDRQRYDDDLSLQRDVLGLLEAVLSNKTDADNQFIAELHRIETEAPDASFDAQGRATQATTVNTKAVVLQFEIDAMTRLTQAPVQERAATEANLLQEARRRFVPGAT